MEQVGQPPQDGGYILSAPAANAGTFLFHLYVQQPWSCDTDERAILFYCT